MKQLTVISGKGGTGKTTLAAAFAVLAERPVVADCDVDAADLHLVLDPQVRETYDFAGGLTASIDLDKCVECGVCRDLCRYDAIDENYVIDAFACEGCGVCHDHCPAEAVTLTPEQAGRWFVSQTRCGPMVHAALNVAQENSGKLVAAVRSRAKEIAEQDGHEVVIIDGSPGVGCPVISSLTGADLALVCTEPTPSGMHALKRVLSLTEHFGIPAAVCVNKADLSAEMTDEIEEYVREQKAHFAGRLPYDTSAVKAMTAGLTVVENGDSPLGQAVRRVWSNLDSVLKGEH